MADRQPRRASIVYFPANNCTRTPTLDIIPFARRAKQTERRRRRQRLSAISDLPSSVGFRFYRPTINISAAFMWKSVRYQDRLIGTRRPCLLCCERLFRWRNVNVMGVAEGRRGSCLA